MSTVVFQVTNHGIPGSLMESVISWLSKLISCIRISNNMKQMIRRIESDFLGGNARRDFFHMRTRPTFHCPKIYADSTSFQTHALIFICMHSHVNKSAAVIEFHTI